MGNLGKQSGWVSFYDLNTIPFFFGNIYLNVIYLYIKIPGLARATGRGHKERKEVGSDRKRSVHVKMT
jgi:hypothetical protein